MSDPIIQRPVRTGLVTLALVLLTAVPAPSQEWTAIEPGSDRLEVLGHLPLEPILSVADIDMEQELDQPYAYVAHMA